MLRLVFCKTSSVFAPWTQDWVTKQKFLQKSSRKEGVMVQAGAVAGWVETQSQGSIPEECSAGEPDERAESYLATLNWDLKQN